MRWRGIIWGILALNFFGVISNAWADNNFYLGVASGACKIVPYKHINGDKKYFEPLLLVRATSVYIYSVPGSGANRALCAAALRAACDAEYLALTLLNLAAYSTSLYTVEVLDQTLQCNESGLPPPANIMNYVHKPLKQPQIEELLKPFKKFTPSLPSPMETFWRVWNSLNVWQKSTAILALIALFGLCASGGGLATILAALSANTGMAAAAVLFLITFFGLDKSKFIPPGTEQAWLEKNGIHIQSDSEAYAVQWTFQGKVQSLNVHILEKANEAQPQNYAFKSGEKLLDSQSVSTCEQVNSKRGA